MKTKTYKTLGVVFISVVLFFGATQFAAASSSPGTAWAWGYNEFGQLGDGTNTDSNAPVAVNTTAWGNASVTAVSSDDAHSCAIAGGKAYCWGFNTHGQLGDGTTTMRNAPVVVNTTAWGNASVTVIDVGFAHTCAIAGGKTYCWGFNAFGQLGDGTNIDSSVPVAVDTSVWGDVPVTAIGVGFAHTCAIAGGKTYCWGFNAFGQLGGGTTDNSSVPVAVTANVWGASTEVTMISVGAGHSCAIAGGKTYCWGENMYGQLGDGTTDNSSVPVAVDSGNTWETAFVTAVNTTSDHSCAVAEGKAYCWGLNTSGQLGDGTTDNSSVPVAVNTTVWGASTAVSVVTVGYVHSCALVNGHAYCWGNNGIGQLGNTNSPSESHIPVAVTATSMTEEISAISAGAYHTLAISNVNEDNGGDSESGGGVLPETGSPIGLTVLLVAILATSLGVFTVRKRLS